MNSELLHISLLAACGNARIAGAEAPFPSAGFELNTVRFEPASGEALTGEAAWFESLRRGGCRELSLAFAFGDEDWTRTAFANGVEGWGLSCRYDGRTVLWRRYWSSSLAGGAYRWEALYREAEGDSLRQEPDPYDLSQRFERLRALLGMLAQLAGAVRSFEWKQRFRELYDGMDYFRKRRLLDASLLPGAFSDEARMLHAAACGAWAFGGMGSWNDEPPDLAAGAGMETMYNDLTNELYRSILYCLACAVKRENIEQIRDIHG